MSLKQGKNMLIRFAGLLLAAGLAVGFARPAYADGILDRVKQRGSVRCGVSENLGGFSFLNSRGGWEGFDVDYCRAISAAIFGTADKAEISGVPFNQSFPALQSGEVDILSRSMTYTISRDTQLGVNFITPNFYTGQSFMVRKAMNIDSVKKLDGAAICVLAGSVTERYISDYFRSHKLSYKPVAVESLTQSYAVYESGRCDAVSTETPSLAIARARFKAPDDHVILPETIAKSYEAPLMREGDDRWFDLVRWVHFALVTAEELGLTSANIGSAAASDDPVKRTFVGADGDIGRKMGLTNDWTVNVIKSVGNYGEIYARNLGDGSALKIPRGMNELYERGGLLYAPSWR